MKRSLPLIAAVAAISASGHALGRECTKDEAYAAEMATDNLLAWKDVYKFYTEFRHCYDGAIAEGAEDKVQLLWANHWSTLPEMIALANKDPGFKALMWRIARSEAFPQDTFNIVLQSASARCPRRAVEFCSVIRATARRAHAA